MAQGYDEYGNPTGQYESDPVDPYAEQKSAVGQWYKQYLGREGSADEIQGWAQNQNFGSVENSIRDSEEGRAYASRAQQPAAAAPTQAAQWNREQFRDQWLGTGSDVNAQNNLLGQYGITLDQAGRGRLPSGDLLDLRFGAKSGINRASWTAVNDPNTPGFENYGSQQNGGGNGGSSMSSSTSITAGNFDPRVQELYEMLLGRAKQGLTIDRNDPNIRSQADAFSANAERARRNDLADLAEREGPIANLRGEQRLTAERLGQQTGAFEAELVGRELGARRNEIAQALTSMQGLLSDQQKMSLTKEMQLLDNALRQQQLGLQGQQLGLEGQRMSQQNDQFLRQLGLQEADRASYWDALRSGLMG
jgi:hypothetical protein